MDERPGTAAARRGARGAARLVAVLLVATCVVVLVRGLLLQAFVIPSRSMVPTLEVGDRILVWRPPAHGGTVRRGDLVVFDGAGVFGPPVSEPGGVAGLGHAVAAAFGVPIGARTFVKRAIGLPGERVTCCDTQGRITVDGRPLAEPYLPPGQQPSTIPFDVTVPPGRVWVMGDNRRESGDSRAHLGDPGGGTVPLDRIVGRAVAVYWPPARAGRVTGAGQYPPDQEESS